MILSVSLLSATAGKTVLAESNPVDVGENLFGFVRSNTYEQYLAEHETSRKPTRSILLDWQTDAVAMDGAQIKTVLQADTKKPALVWENESGSLQFSFRVEEEGLYQLFFTYKPLSETARNIDLELLINGKVPFESATRITLPRTYCDTGGITQDQRGNDIRSPQRAESRWMTEPVKDFEGTHSTPLYFYFPAGENTLTLKAETGMFAIDSIVIENRPSLPTYAEYSAHADKSAVTGFLQLYQCENSAYKSDSVLHPICDRSGPETMPSDPVRLRLNTIGGDNWADDGQFIVWEINVDHAGWYKLALRYRQNLAIGRTSYRSLRINNSIPFAEASEIPFHFSNKWKTEILGDKNGDWLFYLPAGKNEIRMDVVPGPMGDIIRQLEEIAFTLNSIYRKIIMVTGTQPDPYRDYLILDQISGLSEALVESKQSIEKVTARLNDLNEGKNAGPALSILKTLSIQISSFLNEPDSIPTRISRFQSNISSFSDYIISAKKQPLSLDYFCLMSPEQKEFEPKLPWYAGFVYGFEAFVGSFLNDYTSVGDVSEKHEAISVWVSSLGRDQVQVIKELADNIFTPSINIPVNVNLVQQSLTAAILSGRGPDVALFITDSPMNLAARGGLTELSQFPTYKEVAGRFIEDAMVPYRYNGGVYALPISQSFPMLFCRNDIFEELGIEIPTNWDMFYKALAVIQKNNMNVGVGNIFASLLHQKGGSYFKDDLQSTDLDSPIAVAAFTEWTNMYTRYGLPLSYNFYTRFRTGEMPMAIEDYTTYNLLKAAAPEISGLWGMYPVPGTVDKNGETNYSVVALNTSAVMLRDAKNPKSAWSFLDWFTSDSTQTEYGLGIESLLGPAGRFAAANVRALKNLPWSNTLRDLIYKQWQYVTLVPQIPASYYVDRNINNAYRRVVYYKENPRETLLYYNRIINAEIKRKNKQLLGE